LRSGSFLDKVVELGKVVELDKVVGLFFRE